MLKQLLSMLGMVLLVLGFSMLFPMALGLYDGEIMALEFGLLGLAGMLAGFLLFKFLGGKGEIEARTAYLLVALSWVLAGVYGALPYLFFGVVPNFSHAFFETISGFTTTGATVINNVEILPRSILLWRSMTQWLGGMGIVVLFVALLSFYGNSGLKMFRAESTGPIKEKVVPRMRETAKILWLTYVVITISEIVVLKLLGMPLFDSICHTFTTVATGGFSVKNTSIAYYDSPAIEAAVTFFMALCGISFGLYFFAFKKKSVKVFVLNSELRLYLGILIFATSLCTIGLVRQGGTLGRALLDSVFQVVSMMTTTGFMTRDYVLWHPALQVSLILVMFVGGCAGSTGGGMKVGRVLIIGKSINNLFRKILHPQAVLSTKVDGRPIQQEVLLMTLSFFFIYMICVAIGTLALSILGLGLVEAFSSTLTAISNVGPAFGLLGPTQTYSTLPSAGLNVMSFLMLAGRLELYTIIILFTKAFWQEA